MKKIIFSFLPWFFLVFGYKALAQDTTVDKQKDKEIQEITIVNSGDKKLDLTIKITGDQITVNGKPIIEFKDDAIIINNKKVIVKEGNSLRFMDGKGGMGSMNWNSENSGVYLGVNTEKTEDGATIKSITKGSPAEKAGLQKGDIIQKVNKITIESPQSLFDAINEKKEKEQVTVTYKRGKDTKTTMAILEKREGMSFSYTTPEGNYNSIEVPGAPMARGFEWNGDMMPGRQKLGLRIQDLEEGKGVKVLEVEDESAAERAGLKKDDIITSIGSKSVSNTDEARMALAENREKSSYPIKATRAGRDMSFEIKIPKKLKTANL
ncbi:MAG: PDZ domain-containing protein [Ferruginibacter sp.]